MTTIIAGADGSAGSEDAVGFAGRLAGATGARLILACAYPVYPIEAAVAVSEYREALRTEADAKLDRMASLAEAPDVTTIAVEDSSPARALQALGPVGDESRGLGLLFIGSRGYGPLRAVLTGGVSGAVLRDAACPVFVTPRGAAVRATETVAAQLA